MLLARDVKSNLGPTGSSHMMEPAVTAAVHESTGAALSVVWPVLLSHWHGYGYRYACIASSLFSCPGLVNFGVSC